jgi:formate dehydrogenase major subunit
MQVDGRGWLFAPSGLKDGPMPTHYEPKESPLANAVYKQELNPARQEYDREGNRYHPTVDDPASDPYPYVFTTYRLTEHHTAGGMSRFQGYLSELQPEMFCEVSPALAAERGLEHGGWATIISARGAIEARVLVTDRIPPLRVQGRTVHQIGLPYHWGNRGIAKGDAANDLLSLVLDPNVHIQESKAATCDIQPGRRPRGAALRRLVAERRAQAADGVLHRHQHLHRLQGLRGRLQGMEPGPRGRAAAHQRQLLRQHHGPGGQHLAPRRLHRAGQAGPGARRRPGRGGRRRGRRRDHRAAGP